MHAPTLLIRGSSHTQYFPQESRQRVTEVFTLDLCTRVIERGGNFFESMQRFDMVRTICMLRKNASTERYFCAAMSVDIDS